MCGHCRTIVAGAFVVGGLVGFLASNLLLNKKYKAIYEAESEKTVEAGKRVVKGLKEKLAKYEATEEEYRQMVEEYISDEEAHDPQPDFLLKAEPEKIPEGKSEEAKSTLDKPVPPRFITEEEFDCDWPELWNKGYIYYSKDRNQWFQLEGDAPMNEGDVVDILSAPIVKELYKKAGAMRKEKRSFFVYCGDEHTLWSIDIWRSSPNYAAE